MDFSPNCCATLRLFGPSTSGNGSGARGSLQIVVRFSPPISYGEGSGFQQVTNNGTGTAFFYVAADGTGYSSSSGSVAVTATRGESDFSLAVSPTSPLALRSASGAQLALSGQAAASAGPGGGGAGGGSSCNPECDRLSARCNEDPTSNFPSCYCAAACVCRCAGDTTCEQTNRRGAEGLGTTCSY